MASIKKRNNKYCVIYSYKNENGETHQKWETFDSMAEAKKRKTEVEYEQSIGTFIVSNATTVADLLEEYVEVYGKNKWSISSYSSRLGMINNYINPLIGDIKLEDLTPRMMDKFYISLTKVKTKSNKNRKARTEYVTPNSISKIHQLLRSAFNQAVKWELMARNPCTNATLPKFESKKRDIWTAETLLHALEVCDDELLSLAINLSFSCSLRLGELLALTWDCINITDEAVVDGSTSLFINKELQRVNKKILETLNSKDVIFRFPNMYDNNSTTLVLKTPKTKTSVRKVFIPRTVVEMLKKRKEQIEEMKKLYGAEYTDYNLVFSHSNGRPLEGSYIRNALNKLIKDNDLPPIVFHSFRHASITYKLKWNGGDMKSVQGDSGHAQLDMITDVYSHIIDEDRRYNAQKFEEQFYNTKGLNLKEDKEVPVPEFNALVENVKKPAYKEKVDDKQSEQELLTKLLNNPETAALLKLLAKNM